MPASIVIREDGTPEAAFSNMDLWHGLNNAGDRAGKFMTIPDAIQLAQLDWDVLPVVSQYEWNGQMMTVPNFKHIIRTDNGTHLGNVTDKYVTLQNRRFAEYLERIFGSGEVVDGAFALNEGRRVVFCIKQEGFNIVLSNGFKDAYAAYVIAHTGHNGKDGAGLLPANIRAVCENTFNAATTAVVVTKDGKIKRAIDALGVNVKHSAKMESRFEEVVTAYDIARKHGKLSAENLAMLGNRKVTQEQKEYYIKMIVDYLHPEIVQEEGTLLESILSKSVPKNVELRQERRSNAFNTLSMIEKLELENMGSQLVDSNNAYLLLQTVSDYMQHNQSYRGTERERAENEFVSRVMDGTATEVTSIAADFLFANAV